MPMVKKRQAVSKGGQEGLAAAEPFSAPAAAAPASHVSLTPKRLHPNMPVKTALCSLTQRVAVVRSPHLTSTSSSASRLGPSIITARVAPST